jgi:electron transfer flavoprotein alpha subunit
VSGILVLAESRGGELRGVSGELVGAAAAIKSQTGGPLNVAVLARQPDALLGSLALAGVDEILTVRTPTDHFEPHAHQRAVEALIERLEPSVVIAAMSVDSLGFAPAVASRLGLGFASDVTHVGWDDGVCVRRPDYGGKVDVELAFPEKACTMMLVREGVFDPPPDGGSPARREFDVEVDQSALASEHLGFTSPPADDIDISTSPFLLSVGRGIEDAADLERFQTLADSIGAQLAVSRPLVDAGWAPASRQVGQSGKSVSPKVYLAMGISGAVQHLAGIRNAGTVIAINRDSEAPIFRVADFGAVADMFDVAEELAERLGD